MTAVDPLISSPVPETLALQRRLASMRYRARKKAARRPIWIGRRRTGSAARGLGRPRIWAGLAGVYRSGPLFLFFSKSIFPFLQNGCKFKKCVEIILCIQIL
jgi:hypothetical protein